jgi:hypothetical protein
MNVAQHFSHLALQKLQVVRFQLYAQVEQRSQIVTQQSLKLHIAMRHYYCSLQIDQHVFAEPEQIKQLNKRAYLEERCATLLMYRGRHIRWNFPLTHYKQVRSISIFNSKSHSSVTQIHHG